MLTPCSFSLHRTQRGVMLIEALVAIAVFSIGVLGLIGLQSAAIRNTDEARQRAAGTPSRAAANR